MAVKTRRADDMERFRMKIAEAFGDGVDPLERLGRDFETPVETRLPADPRDFKRSDMSDRDRDSDSDSGGFEAGRGAPPCQTPGCTTPTTGATGWTYCPAHRGLEADGVRK